MAILSCSPGRHGPAESTLHPDIASPLGHKLTGHKATDSLAASHARPRKKRTGEFNKHKLIEERSLFPPALRLPLDAVQRTFTDLVNLGLHRRLEAPSIPWVLQVRTPSAMAGRHDNLSWNIEWYCDDSSSRMKGQKRAAWLQAKATPPKYMIKNPKKGIAGNNTDVPNNQLKIEHPTTEVGGPAQRSLICDDMYKTPEATKMMFPFVGSTSASPMEELSLFASSSVAIRLLENINQFDLNARVLDEERINSPVRKKPVVQGNYADSPWKAGLILPDKDYIVTANFFNWLTSTNETIIKASLVIHDIPRFIDISGLDIKEQFTGQKSMSYEVFDIAIRTLNQKENLMYLTAGRLHWRHYLESDFAMYALSDEKPSDSLHIREQFIGSSVECDLPNCRILVVPVRSKYCWWSYVMDFGAKKCYIIDPSSSKKTSVEILNLHDASEEKVLKALEQTLDDLFIGWKPKWSLWSTEVVKFPRISCPSNLTGLYTLYCVNNFDGAGFAAAPTEAAINSFARNLVYEMIELKGNRAPKPKDFVQIIED
ncbi:hypothetical protein ACP70R_023258 [Stipagrostis hirtigluma subsp. patula]